jgi:ribonuclease HI
VHVAGHSGDPGNDQADALAVAGTYKTARSDGL